MKRVPVKPLVKRSLTILLLVNFINLSANFYIPSSHNNTSIPPSQNDPMDTMAELVLEYVMEMPEDTIPDTEAPSSDKNQKIKDLKSYYLPIWFSLNWKSRLSNLGKYVTPTLFLDGIQPDIPSPPPQQG